MSPSDALVAADAAGAYLLTDRSTLLRQTALQTIRDITVFFEPASPHDVLMNSCNALIPAHAPRKRSAEAARFLGYLLSVRGQKVIAAFGREELGGFSLSLFAPAGVEFANSLLRGVVPRKGQWRIVAIRSRL